MNRLLILLSVLLAAVTCVNCGATQAQLTARRVPLARSKVVLASPATYGKHARLDPKTGKEVSFDPRPRVEAVDAKSGKYVFKWIGYDGKEKAIAYQRADAIDVIVSGSVAKLADGNYLYTYEVENLASSHTYLSHFIVQSFAADTRPIEINGMPTNNQDLRLLDAFRSAPPDGPSRNLNDLHIGQMSSLIQVFREGNWISFGLLPTFTPQLIPGRKLTLKLVSSASPSVVSCRVTGGELTLKGVGEDMPTELEAAIPGYEEFPEGTTIGPVASAKALSASDRARSIRERLPQFEKLGWMTASAHLWYDRNLKNDDWQAVLKQAQQDLNAQQITSEIFALLQAIKQ